MLLPSCAALTFPSPPRFLPQSLRSATPCWIFALWKHWGTRGTTSSSMSNMSPFASTWPIAESSSRKAIFPARRPFTRSSGRFGSGPGAVRSSPRFPVPPRPSPSRQDRIAFVRNSFEIGPVHVGEGRLFLIAGPCVIESEAHVRAMADAIQRITSDVGIPLVFKASYDKANRTSVKSFRGPGIVEGTRILGRLARETGLPVLTDVHEPAHCEIAAEAVDVLQIPAFLCRQTDILVAAGRTGRAVNIKKGQFVAPWDMNHPVEKVRSTGNDRVFLTERGSSFGYNTLVVDYRSLPVMRHLAPVVFDGTHSVQQPSAANGVSGGQPEFIPLLARAAAAAGIDGLFLEVHDDPANAKSDGANALDLKLLKPLLEKLLAIHAV